MATWTNITANSASFETQTTANQLDGGEPIGLLLALTYTTYQGVNSYSNQTANSASWTNQTVN